MRRGSQRFITDNGRSVEVRDTKTRKLVTTLPRYALWSDAEEPGKPQVVGCSDDLELLREGDNDIPIIDITNIITN